MAKLLVLSLLAIVVTHLIAGSDAAPAANARAKRYVMVREGDINHDGVVETKVVRHPRQLIGDFLNGPILDGLQVIPIFSPERDNFGANSAPYQGPQGQGFMYVPSFYAAARGPSPYFANQYQPPAAGGFQAGGFQ